jgi:hypothetical protein
MVRLRPNPAPETTEPTALVLTLNTIAPRRVGIESLEKGDSSMANCNIDPQFQTLAKISEGERLDYEQQRAGQADIWKGSPFEWLCPRPSSKEKGKIGEKILKKWCEQNNIQVQESGNEEFDLLIGKSQKPVEVKLSTLWQKKKSKEKQKKEGEKKAFCYKFQQIRDQCYEYLVCLGVSPNDAHCWVFPKDWLFSTAKAMRLLRSQHTGIKGTDTYWLTIDPGDQQLLSFLSQQGFGGKLCEAIQIMQNW